jgi:DNA-binding transcriptional regulator LsrR (DeoR family)
MERGAVAEIGQRFLDTEGQPVVTSLTERVIGMGLGQLRAVPRVVALAGGQKKSAAISAVLKSGVLDILITDKFTAQRLVDAAGPTPGEDFASPGEDSAVAADRQGP